MIIRGSRYERSTLVRVKQANAATAMAVYLDHQVAVVPVDYSLYTVTAGDRLDSIASAAYGSAALWWIVARANPEVFYPDDIPAGTVLRIPSVESVR